MAKRVLSERGQRYLQTHERRPYANLTQLRAALKAAHLPATAAVLDFHRTFAGYVIDVWGEAGTLGIIHPEIHATESWANKMKVGGYLKGDEPLLACADIHMSWEMMIGLDGTFYCNGPEASSYFMWVEQTAYLWDFWNARPCANVKLPLHTAPIAAQLTTTLAPYRLDELSDDYGQVYGSERFAVSIGRDGERCVVLVAEGDWPPELASLQPRPRKKPPAKPKPKSPRKKKK